MREGMNKKYEYPFNNPKRKDVKIQKNVTKLNGCSENIALFEG